MPDYTMKQTKPSPYPDPSGPNYQFPDPYPIQARPDYAQYQPVLDPGGGILPGFSISPETVPGYGQLQELATGTGLSAWGQAAQDELGQQVLGARAGIRGRGESAISQAMSNLARTGGLTEGERQRLQARGAKDILFGRQRMTQAGLMGQEAIATQDALAREEAKGTLLDIGKEARLGDIETQLAEAEQQRKHRLDLYKIDLLDYISRKKAAEMEG